MGAACALIGAVIGSRPLLKTGLVGPLLVVLAAVSVSDVRALIVPNRLVYPALCCFLVSITASDLAGGPVDAVRGLLGAAVYGVRFSRFTSSLPAVSAWAT